MIRFTSLLALFIAGCKPQAGAPGGTPSDPAGGSAGGGSGPCKLAGEWTGTFTLQLTPEILAQLQAVRPDFQQVLAQMQNEVRATFAGTRYGVTPAGEVTLTMPNGQSVKFARAGDEFMTGDPVRTGQAMSVTRILSHSVTESQITTTVLGQSSTGAFDMGIGGGAITAIGKSKTTQSTSVHTFRLVGDQMQVEMTLQQGASLVGTFNRGGAAGGGLR